MSSLVLLEKYSKWIQNKVTIFPRCFPILHLSQLSLKLTKNDLDLIFPVRNEGRRNTRHSEQQSICSRNSHTGKWQRVYWLPVRLLSISSWYGRLLTNTENEICLFILVCVNCYKPWPVGEKLILWGVETTETPPFTLISSILSLMSATRLFCISSDSTKMPV